jgi:eukaryotic-like serine/threonine-protein kinase
MPPLAARHDLSPTGPVSPALSSARPAQRCRVHLSAGGTRFSEQITELLRSRLKIVSAIALFPLLALFVRNLVLFEALPRGSGLVLALQGVVAAVTTVLAGVLWLRPCLTRRGLRGIELALFGSLALFFGWLQFNENFHLGGVLTGTCRECDLDTLNLMAAASALRWFFIMVTYGVFIPNTWQRCAAVVGGMGVSAVGLTALGAGLAGQLNATVVVALGTLAILLCTSAAIAIFGSYRIHALQEKAFEAQQLGQYRLKKRLGSGGMGEVYLAEHVLLRRPCAVKLIRPEQAGDPTSLQRFEREVRAMATLTHWNTVEVFDYGHNEDGTFYYVMEYLPGRTLETLVQRHGPLPAGRAVYLLRQVCRALREAHGIGLLHRDIKPSNVMACPRGGEYDVAKLLDFGLVQSAGVRGLDAESRLTSQGAIVGSPPYMSPEQAAGKELDERSDIYSLGAVAYHLLTGQPPFQRETPMQTLLAHAYEPVPLPSSLGRAVPEELTAVVLRCLEKEPGNRYPDADSLEKALAACPCAAEWTEADAREWWRREARNSDTAESVALDVPTAAL